MVDMIRQAQKIRIYPTVEQKQQLAGAMGCCRFWWNYALSKSISTYKQTGKGLSRSALNALLPNPFMSFSEKRIRIGLLELD